MTLIEVVVTIALVCICFIGIYGLFLVSLDVVTGAKARAGALALASERMEQIRSLSYTSIGTVRGIPAGTTPQVETVTLNQTTYTRRTFIDYVDDPVDGTGNADSNGITADYKRVKVEIDWSIRNVPRSYSIVSSFAPSGIESTAGGGTLLVQVFDALAQPVADALVHVVNTTGTTSIDVTTYTDATGIVSFPGTPANSGYQITASKSGYSTAQTYSTNGQNPNPNPGHLTIAVSKTTSGSFAIDRLSSLTLRTLKPIETKTWSDTFADASNLVSMSSTTVSGGTLVLGAGKVSGSALSTSTTPSYLYTWDSASWASLVPTGSSAKVHVYTDVSGSPVLLPDSVLSGNTAGFATSPVSLLGVSISVYPSLLLGADLTLGSATTSPSFDSWTVAYDKGPTPIPDIPFSMRGNKTIGTNSGGSSIYKFNQSLSTNSSGSFSTSTLEWDTYTPSIDPVATGYDISEACPTLPFALSPGDVQSLDLQLSAHTSNSLLAIVRDSVTSAMLSGVSVRLTKSGVDSTQTTSSCGQTFFSGLSASSAYTLTLSKTGYQSTTINNVNVSGTSASSVSMTPL